MKNSLEDLHNHLAYNAVMNLWYAGFSPEYSHRPRWRWRR